MNYVHSSVAREQNNQNLFSMLCGCFHTFYVLNIRGEGGVEVIGAHLQHSRDCAQARQREGKETRAIKQSKMKALNRNGHDTSTDHPAALSQLWR